MAKHGEKIIASRFGRAEGTDPELLKIADTVNRNGIRVMLDVCFALMYTVIWYYTNNLLMNSLRFPTCEKLDLTGSWLTVCSNFGYTIYIMLTGICFAGHTWSPTLELTPALPLRHGHAVSIDMAFSVTLAWTRGYITEEERDEFHGMLSRVGLAMDHPQFDNEVIEIGTKDILYVL